MAANMTPLSIAIGDWVAGGDGKVRGLDPLGLLGGGLEYTLANHPTTVLWVEDGYVGTENGTELEPYSTLRTALDNTTDGVGATIVIKDATINVTSSNRTDWMINDRTTDGFSTINSGASWATSVINRDNMVTIKAETPYGVRMSYTGTGGFYRSFVHLQAAEYISVDGFIFEYDETSGNALLNGVSVGNNNYISRCIVKRAADGNNGSWFSMTAGDAATDASGQGSLVEMCAGVGANRYGFRCGDSADSTTDHVFRLCIGRQDFSEWDNPNAIFAHYGNNSGYGSGNSAWLNCTSLDSRYVDTLNTNLVKFGSFYMLKDYDDIRMRGCLALNEGAKYGSFALSTGGDGRNMDAQHLVAWDTGEEYDSTSIANPALRGNSNEFLTNDADYLTFGNNGTDGAQHSGNNIQVGSNTRFNDVLNGTDPSILYQNDGADIRYVYGALGTRWGDAGYDQVTTEPAYPWPYEDAIKSVFTEQLNTPTGHTPAGNTSNRGFCAAASLTDYIIKYVDGTTTLAEVYP